MEESAAKDPCGVLCFEVLPDATLLEKELYINETARKQSRVYTPRDDGGAEGPPLIQKRTRRDQKTVTRSIATGLTVKPPIIAARN